MKTKSHPLNERGIAHLGLILLVLVVIGAGAFAYTRVNTAKDDKNTTQSTSKETTKDNSSDDATSINKANQEAEDVPAVNTQEAPDVAQ